MVRLSRAQAQERNRARVLAAARSEFAELGFRDAKIDAIAERAELTRGAVYSNFPGKRALYLAVLAEDAEHAPAAPHAEPASTVRDALGLLARAWVAALPFAEPYPLGAGVLAELRADERTRRPFAQLLELDAVLLGLAMERLEPPESPAGAPPRRLVRTAKAVLTTLYGARELASAAPGFGEPFDVISACERLAGLELGDWWAPPDEPPPARRADEPWSPPSVADAVRGEPVEPTGDGVVAVLGLHRLAGVEQAVRSAPPGTAVTAAIVTGDPAELAPLARLTLAELTGGLRQAFPRRAWPAPRVVCDASGALAAAAGVPAVSDETEVAVRVEAGRIVARAEGRGACHTVASAGRSPEWLTSS